jgi:hypothetical protein
MDYASQSAVLCGNNGATCAQCLFGLGACTNGNCN